MWFDFARKEGYPTQYAPNETAVTVDVLEAGLVTAFVILAVSFLVSLPSTKIATNAYLFIRVSVLLSIGLILLVGNFGQDWEVGDIVTKTPYKAGTPVEINAAISVKIGLRSVNVTLKSIPPQNEKLRNEIINYNERFSWTWDQGRFGFGPYAGHLQQEFRAAQYRGLPTPILWIVDYFVIDGEGFRYGRFYRTAGWYSHIVLWCAFACWLVALILFRSVISYGAISLGLCGVLQLTANLLWAVIRNPLPLAIPFENATITTKFGISYWLTFVCGIACIAIAVAIILMGIRFDTQLYTFFGVDPLDTDELAYLTRQEHLELRQKTKPTGDVPLITMNKPTDEGSGEFVPVYLKRRTLLAPPAVSRKNKPRHMLNTAI